jgi:hypothetical protein
MNSSRAERTDSLPHAGAYNTLIFSLQYFSIINKINILFG